MNRRSQCVRWAVGLLVCMPAFTALGEVRYTVVDIPHFAGGRSLTTAHGINNSGQVVGLSAIGDGGIVSTGYMWDPVTGMTRLRMLPGTSRARATAINDHGFAVGVMYFGPSTDPTDHAVLWRPDGSVSELGTLGGSISSATDISNSGHVTGRGQYESSQYDFHAFLWSADAYMADVGDLLNGSDRSNGYAVNSAGQVVGNSRVRLDSAYPYRGFVWENGGFSRILAGTAGDLGAVAYDITDAGRIVGGAKIPEGSHAVIWETDGSIVDLGRLPGPIGGASAKAINNFGQVVGASDTLLGSQAFLWDPDEGIQNLNDLIDPAAGWNLEKAEDINDDGWIVGEGTSPDGYEHGFVLIPVNPEPSTLILLSLGGGCIRLLARRRTKR